MKNLATKNTNDFTITESGDAFISQTAVSKLCGVGQDAISKHIVKTGHMLNINSINQLGFESLELVIGHYAFDSQRTNDVALNSYRTLAKAGAKVTAFEPHLRYGPIGEFLVKEKKFDIDWYNVQFEQKLVSQRQFDVVLMLSVFQWMADGGNTFREANECLRRISEMSRYMIFELGFNKGKSCIRTAKRNHYAALVQLLYNNTAYRNFMLLGTTRLWASYSRYLVLCSNDERYEDSIFRRIIRMIKV